MSKYAVVDLEMCNVPRSRRHLFNCANELIQIGAVLLDDNLEIVDTFQTYISPEFGILDSFIENLTGITPDDLRDAPKAQEALRAFGEWLPEDVTFVSWSNNDERQIRKEMEAKGIVNPKVNRGKEFWTDCQIMFADKLTTRKHYRLSEALVIADIDFDENIHNALIDAQNTALLFAKLTLTPDFELIDGFVAEGEEAETLTCNPFAEFFKRYGYVS